MRRRGNWDERRNNGGSGGGGEKGQGSPLPSHTVPPSAVVPPLAPVSPLLMVSKGVVRLITRSLSGWVEKRDHVTSSTSGRDFIPTPHVTTSMGRLLQHHIAAPLTSLHWRSFCSPSTCAPMFFLFAPRSFMSFSRIPDCIRM